MTRLTPASWSPAKSEAQKNTTPSLVDSLRWALILRRRGAAVLASMRTAGDDDFRHVHMLMAEPCQGSDMAADKELPLPPAYRVQGETGLVRSGSGAHSICYDRGRKEGEVASWVDRLLTFHLDLAWEIGYNPPSLVYSKNLHGNFNASLALSLWRFFA